jgi:hypothetical protein
MMTYATRTATPERPAGCRISAPVNRCEQEADRAADQAVKGGRIEIALTPGAGVAAPSDGDVPADGGRPLEPTLRSTMDRSFGHDFAAVRVHADAAAAHRQNAAAYTVGQHIVIGATVTAADTAAGRWLYAHEMAHIVQQSGPSARRAVQRVGIGEWFARLFGGGTFGINELKAYLRYLDDHGEIEGERTSDNKAREIVKRWRNGDPDFPEPTLPQKQLMLLEMIDGPTLDEDEHAILELLRGSSDEQVRLLVATAGGEQTLADEFHGSEFVELQAFLATWRAEPQNRPVQSGEIGAGRGQVAIAEITVDQDTPQTVMIRYRDGRREAFRCSTGKGTCAVESGGKGPTRGEMERIDSNWTPNSPSGTGFRVSKRDKPGSHGSIEWWTQFHDRQIALHDYSRVDGTPLSHGCVRLEKAVAKRIYDGALDTKTLGGKGREAATRVVVTGVPKPRLAYGPLVDEWERDFAQGSGPVRDSGDRELREHLRLALGADGAELDRRIKAGVIPRCADSMMSAAGERRHEPPAGVLRCPDRSADCDCREQPAAPQPDEIAGEPGQVLEPAVRGHMERLFGYDFSHVRVHAGDRAAASARGLDALAYSTGQNIVFGPGQYVPGTQGGQRLIAHELAHQVQQTGAARGGVAGGLALEQDAERAAAAVAAGTSPAVRERAPSALPLRQAAPSATAASTLAPPKLPDIVAGTNVVPSHVDAEFNRPNALLTVEKKVLFEQDDSIRPWPSKARFQEFVAKSVQKVAARWSFKHSLVPVGDAPGEPPRVAVRVKLTAVSSGEHLVAKVRYIDKDFEQSSAWVKTATLDQLDVEERSDAPQTPVEHEFGHMLGIHHINCSTDADVCYGKDRTSRADVMGKSSWVSPRDYEHFATILGALTAKLWRVLPGATLPASTAPTTGAWVGGILGGLAGAGLGAAIGSLGGPIGIAIGALVGGLAGIFGGRLAGESLGRSEAEGETPRVP